MTDDLMMGRWRNQNERSQLVERIIHLERRLRIYEQAMRDQMTEHDQLTWALARIEELETICEHQTTVIATLNRKAAS